MPGSVCDNHKQVGFYYGLRHCCLYSSYEVPYLLLPLELQKDSLRKTHEFIFNIFNKTGTMLDVKEQKRRLKYSSQMMDL